MIHLSSYHSNGLPPVVWSNKVNLIGEKVYKPKIHFCEYCNKPILIYGRLIPCKHVFCYTCATLCLIQTQKQALANIPLPCDQPNDTNHHTGKPINSPHQTESNNRVSNSSSGANSNYSNESNYDRHSRNQSSNHNGCKNLDINRSSTNYSYPSRDGKQRECSSINNEDSASNTTPNTVSMDVSNSPCLNGSTNVANGGSSGSQNSSSNDIKGCHRCGNRALRVERNTLNSIFVCQIDSCKRTYLSARDLQAHFNHRHSRNKNNNNNNNNNNNQGPMSASMHAVSSSPYISSSTIMHLNSQHQSLSATNNKSSNSNHNNNSPNTNNYHSLSHRRERDLRDATERREREREIRERERFRDRERDKYQRERERERNSKEYHRQSMQRAAQWAEASAQMLEKGLTR